METAAQATTGPRWRSWGKVALILLPAVLVIGLLSWATLREGRVPQAGDAAPPFTAPRLTGHGTLSLADFKGRPVLLNFWASWCAPCEDEAPILNRAERRFGQQVAFVGVNIKDARDDAIAFEHRFHVPYDSVRDLTQEIYDSYGLTGQPETFLIDGNGTIVQHVPGALPNQAFVDRLLDRLVGRAGP